jgi:hypothetical protein
MNQIIVYNILHAEMPAAILQAAGSESQAMPLLFCNTLRGLQVK